MVKVIKRIVLYVVLIYGGLIVFVSACQRSLIYYPVKGDEARLMQAADVYGMEAWRDGKGEIIGWVAEPVESEVGVRNVLVFHGNAGNAVHRSYYVSGLRSLPEEAGVWRVYIFEYPGYGARSGRPSEVVIKEAAEAALKLLMDENEGEPVYFIGESLGGGVASYLAAKNAGSIQGVLMVTPFTRLVDVGRKHYPFLPVGWILREEYDNVVGLSGYGGAVAFLLAGRDEVIPVELGRCLYEGYEGPKRLWVQEGKGHNDLEMGSGAPWWGEVVSFLIAPDASGSGRP